MSVSDSQVSIFIKMKASWSDIFVVRKRGIFDIKRRTQFRRFKKLHSCKTFVSYVFGIARHNTFKALGMQSKSNTPASTSSFVSLLLLVPDFSADNNSKNHLPSLPIIQYILLSCLATLITTMTGQQAAVFVFLLVLASANGFVTPNGVLPAVSSTKLGIFGGGGSSIPSSPSQRYVSLAINRWKGSIGRYTSLGRQCAFWDAWT